MEYKYQKRQIFGKRLKVPKFIYKQVYNCNLSLQEYFEYELDDKIPISCVIDGDRQIVEKFGINKCKELDWDLLNKSVNYSDTNFRELLMSIEPSVKDINSKLYDLAKDQIKPSDYTARMKKRYSGRLFDLSDNSNKEYSHEMRKFNDGEVSLIEIVRKWDLYKDKDLSYCLNKDPDNKFGINDIQLKKFMSEFGEIVDLAPNNIDIHLFINDINNSKSGTEKQDIVKKVTDAILDKTLEKNNWDRIELTDKEYRQLFKYSSMSEYLKKSSGHSVDELFKELKYLGMSEDFLFDTQIPFELLKNSSVLRFITTYGLKNVVDFDNECGHFFTKNNCEMLKLMYPMYFPYANNNHDPNTTIFTKNHYDDNGNYVDRPYTKDEFYEAMRRMIIYGPSGEYYNKAPDYRDMTGEFRVRNAELFISEQAPEELQKLFYTKSITPQLLVEHPEYIEYLNGKNLGSCFKQREIEVEDSNKIENFYNFLSSKTDFNGVIKFITEYSGVLDFMFDLRGVYIDIEQYIISVSTEDDISQIQRKTNESFKKLIIEKGLPYPKNIPQNLIENYPSIFLSNEAPQELKEAFYNRTINTEFILSNPIYRNYLENIDLEVLYKSIPVSVIRENHRYGQVNLISAIKQTFGDDDGFDVMLLYGKYIESVFEANRLQNFRYSPSFSKDDLLDELDSNILQTIIDGKMKYDERISSHFKNNNPTLFLRQNVSQDIRNKFYNREFTLNDFNSNPDLLEVFGDTNVVCGFSENIAWMIPLFNDSDNLKIANFNRLKVISEYSKIQDVALRNAFKEYVMKFGNNIEIEKIEYVSEILSRLSLSNSSEIFTFRKELATQILRSSNPSESLSEIEDIFIRNNIPTVGKIYSCFEILHPDFQGFNFKNSMISPILTKSSTMSKKIIAFSDLIKTSFGSNNRSINSYLKNIEIGSKLYESIKNGHVQYDALNEIEQNELITFSKHLVTLYNNTMKGKKESDTFMSTGNVLTDILELSKKLSPDGSLDYNLADRVIRMFCGFAGIDTLEQAKIYIDKKIQTADSRNRDVSNSDMVLKQGDFIKGIKPNTLPNESPLEACLRVLPKILQNGSVSKEYLGSSAGSDATPLDTDISMIMNSDGTIQDKISSTAASNYGPIWLVLKNDERFITTRDNKETLDTKRDMSKMEVFYTGVLGEDHYGIRTGFASSEINYIVMENYDPRVGLEIAMNGFYIPIADKDGKIVFTPNDYDRLREKMNGLSYFDENNYIFSENLVTEETEYLASQIERSNYEVQSKQTKINEVIKESLDELGLHLKTTIDGDLTEGFVELIDTGSTGRGTNKPGDGDFDFMMRLDKTVLSTPSKLNELKQTILKNLGKDNSSELTGTGDFRLKNVQIDSEINVDIDITFAEKTDKVSYSTDMALQDRLTTIQRTDPEKYKYVVANILLAKQVLKEAGAYKPNRGETPQGGLGGVGIENWILQNGGSFIDAAGSFIEASEGKSFSEFQSSYQIWDFGDNHLAERRGQYPHDNFVATNMSDDGFHKMREALIEYVNKKELSEEIVSTQK